MWMEYSPLSWNGFQDTLVYLGDRCVRLVYVAPVYKNIIHRQDIYIEGRDGNS